MKIVLCKDTKDVEKIAKFLDRNLKKVSIEYKDCPPDFEKYKDAEVVAKVDGKVMHAPSAYGILKEIRKYLKKEDKMDLLDEEAMKKTKKEYKAELEREKEQARELRKKKNAADKTKAPHQEMSIAARIVGDEVILFAPNETFSLDHMRITLDLQRFGKGHTSYALVNENAGNEEMAEVKETAPAAEEAKSLTSSAQAPAAVEQGDEEEAEGDQD